MKTKLKSIYILSLIILSIGQKPSGFNKFKIEYKKLESEKKENIKDLLLEDICKINPNIYYSVKNIKLVKGFDDHDILVADFLPFGYSIFDINSGIILEVNPYSNSVIDNLDYENYYYYPWKGFYYKKNNVLYDAVSNQVVNKETTDFLVEKSKNIRKSFNSNKNEKNLFFLNSSKDFYNQKNILRLKNSFYKQNENEINFIYGEREIKYSWYFKLCDNDNFPSNTGSEQGICGYVGASMNLAFSEIFKVKGFFSEEESEKYLTKAVTIPSYAKDYNGDIYMYFKDIPKFDDSFPYDIWGDDIGSSEPIGIEREIREFLRPKFKEGEFTYTVFSTYWLIGDVKSAIHSDCPAIYFGHMTKDDFVNRPIGVDEMNHALVIYGIFNEKEDRYICHTGWDNTESNQNNSQVILSGLGFLTGGFVYVKPLVKHKHAGYFINEINGTVYCGCGEVLEC